MPAIPSRGIVLAGGGKMGSALLTGWLESGVNAAEICVVEPEASAAKRLAGLGVKIVAAAAELPGAAETVIFAVKPQIMNDVVPNYMRLAGGETVFLSIAAGCTISLFETHLGAVPVVRAMPNTPAAIGLGITVACANGRTSDGQKARCQKLLEAVGEVAWVSEEGLMDPVTAVSGSGPAYVFLLIETLAAAGMEAGLSADLAMRLARATVRGAGELASRSEDAPDQLRVNVTSPGGTTAAALEVLMAEDGLGRLMKRAVLAATDRSKALAG
ncbi:MAG: pyrroline-5-carboxylate reductase [Proteobacteria bacterium]|nr:pyrroline-5-carboxylate reductase [Pseudomonadota bacterium]MDA1354767.1 pyrroline-5-carboxylate reductase [Pseudomonadota bacterium]